MAKAKKQEKPIEQRLEEALVLYEKTPYELPSNWCWVKLPLMYQNVTSSDKKIPQKSYLEEGQYSIVDQGKDLVGGYTNDNKYLYEGTLPVVIFGDHTRAVKYIDFEFAQGADGVKVLKPAQGIYPKYLYYCIKNLNITDLGYRRHFPLFPQYCAPLAPLEEQKRIVEIIEKQFAKLDEARDLIQKSLDSFADRKSAILHKAFTGELTKKWRESNSIFQKWEETTLCNVVDVRDGTHDSPQFFDTGYPLVTSKNLKNGKITDDNIKHISQEDYEKINERSKVDIYDILFAMIGTIGNPVVVGIEPKFAIKNVALLKHIGKINPYFVKYYLESKSVTDKMKDEARGSTQKFVSLGYLRSFPIKVPSKGEQEEIVRILDSIFEKEDKSKELLDMLDKIDEMKKSILARAFRGELGTFNPTDEPAVELLKKILDNDKDESNQRKRVSKTSISFDYSLLKNNVEVGVIKEIVKKGGKVTTDYFNKNHIGLSIFEIVKVVDLLIKRKILKTEEGWLILNTNED